MKNITLQIDKKCFTNLENVEGKLGDRQRKASDRGKFMSRFFIVNVSCLFVSVMNK